MTNLKKVQGLYLVADVAKALNTSHANINMKAHARGEARELTLNHRRRVAVGEEFLKELLVQKWETKNSAEMARRSDQLLSELFSGVPGGSSLIPLTRGDDGIQAVMGRDLHEFLEVGRDYTTWFKQMVGYGFEENIDFATEITETAGQPGSPNLVSRRKDHVMTLDMAKEVAMIQRTDKGKQARRYFIEVEKEYREARLTPAEDGSAAEIARLQEDNGKLREDNGKLRQALKALI